MTTIDGKWGSRQNPMTKGRYSLTRVTISNVAKAAGVSMKSVSRVVNREPNVSEKLRLRVQSAINALCYVPDFAARSLAGGRAFTIGLLFHDYGDAFMPSYYPKLQSGAYRACRQHGYHLLVEHVQTENRDFPEQFERALSTMRVDGFILPPPLADDERIMDMLEKQQIPFARIAPSTELHRAPYVAIDDEAAAREMAGHLWAIGHRDIAFVMGMEDHPSAHARRSGFTDALLSLGCSDLVEVSGQFRFENGIGAAKTLMQSPNPPTAIFAANDDSAAGVMAGLAQMGLKVPDDVSVAGFDDSWIAMSVWPYLTTIHQPIAEMAAEVAAMLIDRNGAMAENQSKLLDFHLIVRGSTAPPKQPA
jgi:LacI family transcriptional regulator